MGFLICEECGGYYKLQPDESPEDFDDKCDCGGKLRYQESLENVPSSFKQFLWNFDLSNWKREDIKTIKLKNYFSFDAIKSIIIGVFVSLVLYYILWKFNLQLICGVSLPLFSGLISSFLVEEKSYFKYIGALGGALASISLLIIGVVTVLHDYFFYNNSFTLIFLAIVVFSIVITGIYGAVLGFIGGVLGTILKEVV